MRFTIKRNVSKGRTLTIVLAAILLGSILLSWMPSGAEEVTYPKDYTHRPMLELFTSLSCAPCMNNAHPAIEEVMNEAENTSGVPFNMVAFHLNNPGSDDLTTPESTARHSYYKDDIVEGVPNMIFDGGYNEQIPSDSVEIQENIDASGGREVKKATLWVRFEIVEDKLEFDVKVNNVDTSNIRGNLYVFIVENEVEAYSSVLDENVSSDHVFRGYPEEWGGGTSVNIGAGGWHNQTGLWQIDTQATIPINPDKLSVVAALYDVTDLSVRTPPDNDFKGLTPRCIQSATPETTEYDGGFPVDPSKITFTSITHAPEEPTPSDLVTITTAIQSTYPLVSVSLAYCVDETCYAPFEMSQSVENYTAEIGPFSDGEEVKYNITAEDDQGVVISSRTKDFKVEEKPGDDDDDDNDDDDDDDPDGSLKISGVGPKPEGPYQGDEIRIFATIASDHDIIDMKVNFWTDGTSPASEDMRKSGTEYYATIGSFNDGTVVYYNVTATDENGNHVSTEEQSIEIGAKGDDDDGKGGDDSPGFGVLATLAVLAGISIILLMRRKK